MFILRFSYFVFHVLCFFLELFSFVFFFFIFLVFLILSLYFSRFVSLFFFSLFVFLSCSSLVSRTILHTSTKTKTIAFEWRLRSLPRAFHTQFDAQIGATERQWGTQPGLMGAYLELVSAQSAHVNRNERWLAFLRPCLVPKLMFISDKAFVWRYIGPI